MLGRLQLLPNSSLVSYFQMIMFTTQTTSHSMSFEDISWLGYNTHSFLLFYLQLPLGRKAFVSRPVDCSWATWCSPWKTGKRIVVRLDIDDSSYHCICCHTGMSYRYHFSWTFDIRPWTGTLCYEFDKYMGQYRWAVQLFGFLLENSRPVWRWRGSRCAH